MMTDRTDKIEIPRMPKDPRPRRPSYAKVARNIEQWANSVGLQKPANDFDSDDLAPPVPSAGGRRGE
jgi:hypothetical protein